MEENVDHFELESLDGSDYTRVAMFSKKNSLAANSHNEIGIKNTGQCS
jgi:hypothetical protein